MLHSTPWDASLRRACDEFCRRTRMMPLMADTILDALRAPTRFRIWLAHQPDSARFLPGHHTQGALARYADILIAAIHRVAALAPPSVRLDNDVVSLEYPPPHPDATRIVLPLWARDYCRRERACAPDPIAPDTALALLDRALPDATMDPSDALRRAPGLDCSRRPCPAGAP